MMGQDTNLPSDIPPKETNLQHRTDLKRAQRERLIVRSERLGLWIPVLISAFGVFCGLMILLGALIDRELNLPKLIGVLLAMGLFIACAWGVCWLIHTTVDDEISALDTQINRMIERQKAQNGAISISSDLGGQLDGTDLP